MVTGVGHVAVRARDLERSAAFYRDVLGLPEAFRLTGPDGAADCLYVQAAPGQFIELFRGGEREPLTGGDVAGYCHLCLRVDDAAAELARLRGLGVAIDRELVRGRSKCVQFWIHDPDGNAIEMMETPPDSLQSQADARYSGNG